MSVVAQGWTRLVERMSAADPGFNRLRLAVRMVAGVGVAMAAAFGVADGAGQPDLIPIVVSALLAFQVGFVVNDATPGRQARSTLVTTAAFVGALLIGTAAHDRRILSLVLLGAFVFVGVWIRRFGPLGVGIGMMAWMGDFIGFYLGAELGGTVWELTYIAVGALSMLAVGLGLFWPRPARALRRTQRSFVDRAKAVADAASEVVLGGASVAAPAARQRLRRAQDRLNEAALMIEAQLATPAALPEGTSAQALHQHLFDAELAIQTVARMVEQLADQPVPAGVRRRIAEAMVGVRTGHLEETARAARSLVDHLAGQSPESLAGSRHAHAAVYRLAGSLVAWADATQAWLALGASSGAGDGGVPFRPTVDLVAGYLPGSASVAPAAAAPGRLGRRFALLPTTRLAVQMTVAVSVAIVVGDAISGRRFYWAVLAAFLAFFGTNTSGEQVTKAYNRVLGTALGLVSGIVLAHLVGHRVHLALAVALVSLFLGIYFMRVSYALFVIGLVTVMGQVYVQFGEFTNDLLLLRLLETGVGAVIAMAVALVVFPVRTDGAVRVALSGALQRLDILLDQVRGGLDAPGVVPQLQHDARVLDHAFQTLAVTARPLSRTLMGSGSNRVTGQLARVSALRHYAANLAHFAERTAAQRTFGPDRTTPIEMSQIIRRLRGSVEAVDAVVAGRQPGGLYERVGADLDRLDRALQGSGGAPNDLRMVLHFLGLIDDTLADLAASWGLRVSGDDFLVLAGERREEIMTTEGALALVANSVT